MRNAIQTRPDEEVATQKLGHGGRTALVNNKKERASELVVRSNARANANKGQERGAGTAKHKEGGNNKYEVEERLKKARAGLDEIEA